MEKFIVQDKEHLSALYLHRVRPNGLSKGSSAPSPDEIGLFNLVARGCTETIGLARRSRFALQIAKVGAGDGTRTRTLDYQAADFKSAASAISPLRPRGGYYIKSNGKGFPAHESILLAGSASSTAAGAMRRGARRASASRRRRLLRRGCGRGRPCRRRRGSPRRRNASRLRPLRIPQGN